MLHRGLTSLSWFVHFLERLKAIITFWHSNLWRGTLVRHLIHVHHLIAIGKLINEMMMPGIAAWRWGTLWLACSALQQPMQETLTHDFDASPFRTSKDSKKISVAQQALACRTWTSRYEFVSWFADWICRIQSWGKGSKQRDAALRTGSEYNHLYNCRRLGEAEAYVNASLTQGLAECQEWDVGTFGSGFSYDDIVELKTCVRASYVLAEKRHAYLSRLPYLIVRIFEPGVKSRILQQYADFDNHHPLTEKFLAPGTQLRHDVDLLDCHAPHNASPRLRAEVEALSLVSLDDSIAESPHALGNQLGRHARGSTFGWVASSMRVPQNLVDVNAWSAALKVDLQQEWLTYTKVLQTSRRNLGRPMRLTPKEFRNRSYHMGLFSKPLRTEAADDALPIVDRAANPDDAAGAVAALDDDEPRRRRRARVDVEQVQLGQQLACMKEYMLACLTPGKYVSFKVNEGDEVSTCFIQVLIVEPNVTVVDVCMERDQAYMNLQVAVCSKSSHLICQWQAIMDVRARIRVGSRGGEDRKIKKG